MQIKNEKPNILGTGWLKGQCLVADLSNDVMQTDGFFHAASGPQRVKLNCSALQSQKALYMLTLQLSR